MNISKLLRDRQFWLVVAIAIFYAGLSFAYSFIGFLHYEPGSHFHEYSGTRLVIEVGGHLLFGFVAALPFMDLRLSLLTSGLAILIDIDHLLSALNFDVSGRPDHSIMYAIVSTLFIIYVGTKLGLSRDFRIKLAFVGAVTLLAHISYDIFASHGSSFQIFIPFSFESVTFGFGAWIYFEVAGAVLAFLGLFAARKYGRKSRMQQITLSKNPQER
ncbi:MAG: hypothetical protein ACYC7D_11560 [Nitrososphaerales archaeon]